MCRMECEKLIKIVRKYPVLYDLCHEDYKNLKTKNKVWEEVEKEMGKTEFSVKDLKKQWKNLRDSYSKHLRSLQPETGPAASNILAYKFWPWAKNMDFVRPFIKFSKSATSVRSCDDNSSNHELPQCNYLSQTENSATSTNLEATLNPTTPIPKNTIEKTENVDPDVGVAIPRKRKKFIKDTATGVNRRIKKKLKKETVASGVDRIISFLQQIKSDTESMDATELMFMGYAKTIQTFSARRQAETKLKISQIVLEQNLLQVEENEVKSKESLGNRNCKKYTNTTPSAFDAS